MLKIIFTLDYEIHGNGDGSPYSLIIEPTDRLLRLFDRFGAKLTIMADVAEILAFKRYLEISGEDDYYFNDIVEQLRNAVKTGHDVQLHVHSSYFKATYENKRWKQDWSEYNLAGLPYKRINELIKQGKNFLEEILIPVKQDYKCTAFRAANWSMQPSFNIITALAENRIPIDTSVYKYGIKKNLVDYDYSSAFSNVIPWFVDSSDICQQNNNGKLLEIPIYCENRPFLAFITPIRFFRMLRARFHKHQIAQESPAHKMDTPKTGKKSSIKKLLDLFVKKHPWKLDFNQAGGRQLINAVKRIEARYRNAEIDLPVAAIGHSKTFIRFNEITLKPFLKFIYENNDKYSFVLFKDLDLESYRQEKIS